MCVGAVAKSPRKALNIPLVWACDRAKSDRVPVVDSFKRFFSFIHSTFADVAKFFRTITLKNAWAGFKSFLHAFFTDSPNGSGMHLCVLADDAEDVGSYMELLRLCTMEVAQGFRLVQSHMCREGVGGILVSATGSVENASRKVLI